MKSVIFYDSLYGNTKKVAEKVAHELNGKLIYVDDYRKTPEALTDADLVIVGCPIQGWRPSEPTRNFLSSLPKDSMSNKYVTAFETRIDVFYSGSAAGKVLKSLNKLGGKAVAEPGKFIVKGTEGPLLEGELEKASQWASQISHRFTSLVNKD